MGCCSAKQAVAVVESAATPSKATDATVQRSADAASPGSGDNESVPVKATEAAAGEAAVSAPALDTSADSSAGNLSGGLDDAADEAAACKIQRWWRTGEAKEMSLKEVFEVFEAEGLSSEWAKSVSFEELALCLQRDELLQATSELLRRLTGPYRPSSTTEEDDDEDDDTLTSAEPARVLLSAFVVSSHPEVR
jgi:hypothetical protein